MPSNDDLNMRHLLFETLFLFFVNHRLTDDGYGCYVLHVAAAPAARRTCYMHQVQQQLKSDNCTLVSKLA